MINNAMSGGPSFRRLDSQIEQQAVFLDDSEQAGAVSNALANEAGGDYYEIPAGQVLGRCWDGLFRPCVRERVTATVTSAAAVPVADAKQFAIGDRVFKAGDPYSLGTVTAIDYSTNTLTLSASVTLATTDYLHVDPARTRAATAGAGATGVNTVSVATGYGARFKVGQAVYLKTSAETVGLRNITVISTDTLTLDGATFDWAAGGEVVTTEAQGGHIVERPYRIAVESKVYDYGQGVRPQNSIISTRTIGLVRERVLRGMNDAILALMRPMLRIDYTTD